MVAWSSLSRREPLPPLPRPKLLRRPDRDADADAAEVAAAWNAYATGERLDVLVRTVHGPRRARVLWRAGTWVVTLCAGAERLTLGPTGMAVPGVAGREACVDLAEQICEAGYAHLDAIAPELGDVIGRWRSERG